MSSASAQEPRYRPAKPIPDELCRHCTIFFDERLYINALNLLTDIVTLGAAQPAHLAPSPAYAPLPFHIELVSVLLIHPRYTNQSTAAEHVAIPSKCIILLRNLLAILGPINARLADAFAFTSSETPSTRTRRGAHVEVVTTSHADLGDQLDRIKGLVANQGRTRRCARDFWHVVGWAFNCSRRYPQRWKYLKVWLEYMIDVLDADWHERTRQDRAATPTGPGLPTALSQAMIVAYLSGIRGSSAAARRVVKALFADGSDDSLNTFPQVFPNEINPPTTHTVQKRKRKDSISGHPSPWPEDLEDVVLDDADIIEHASVDEEAPEPESDLGGSDALVLRQRLIALLSHVATTVPHLCTSCAHLHELMYDHIRPLPLPSFARLLTSTPSSHLPAPLVISLSRLLLSRLPTRSSAGGGAARLDDPISQRLLEQCYLPLSAPAAALHDQTKVSILLENLVRLLCKDRALRASPALAAALDQGIAAREASLMPRKKKGLGRVDDAELDSAWLKASSLRLRALLSWTNSSHNSRARR
ncbi:hypothetical protein K3495_g4072 [Podosphaera aphanis]|nr:hypothetical protein K3495_g4072 [Podosphaera aphanis]